MKHVFTTFLLVVFAGISLSLQSAYKTEDFVGSWKIKSITKSSGTHKKGDKIVTFNKDNTTISYDKSSKSSRYGKWFYNPVTEQIQVSNEDGENEIMDVVKLTKSKLELFGDGKSFLLVRVKSPN